jgi:hypothetical protein
MLHHATLELPGKLAISMQFPGRRQSNFCAAARFVTMQFALAVGRDECLTLAAENLLLWASPPQD